MTSSSYQHLCARSTSLRKSAYSFYQKQVPIFGVTHIPKLCLIDRRKQSPAFIANTIFTSSTPRVYQENTRKISKIQNECTSTSHYLASRKPHGKHNKTQTSNDHIHNSMQSTISSTRKDAKIIPRHLPGTLCSYLNDHNYFSGDSKVAPTTTPSLRNFSEVNPLSISSSSSVPTSMKLSSYSTKEVENSWRTLWTSGPRHSSINNVASQTSKVPNNLSRIFHAVYNYQWHRDFLIKKSSFGRKTMSLSLLLDPIIGSPPSTSALNSPLVEARDDISALSEGFTRKVKLHRRRLSTSFDIPSASDHGGDGEAVGRVVKSVAVGNTSVEHVGPFAFRELGLIKKAHVEAKDDECEEKKAKLNAWLEQLHHEAIIKAESGANDNSFPKSDGKGDGRSSQSGGGDDGGENSSKPSSPAFKHTEDLFQLLEKVIECKGRNISHITVEQSVKHLCTVYVDASDDEKLEFFTILAEKYGVDHNHVTSAAANLASCKDDNVRLTLEEKLRAALVPKSQWLFSQIGRLENGVKFLVDFRVDLLDAIEVSKGKSSLKALNNSLRDLIGMWFNVGFLNLERVTWQSSCDMLQKVSEYEAVHPMRNSTDLKKRVGPNRRCFVFTHNSMPGEPVVVLHTFLTDHISSSVQKIVSNHRMRMMSLDSDLPMAQMSEDPDLINTAVFYSITSTQRGLTGIELGNYLIKRVVRELQSEFPKMTQYSTLSPIPGFKNWLVSSFKNALKAKIIEFISTLEPASGENTLLTEAEMSALRPIFGTEKHFYEAFLDVLKLNSWFSDEKLVKELEKPLMRLCAQYLYLVKRRGYALDPVANFHLKNGAVIWRINWLGDESPRGLGQSCGMMVNYRYFLDTCESNSQNYMENQVIQISDQVKHLVKPMECHL